MTGTHTLGNRKNDRLNPHLSSEEWAGIIASALQALRACFNLCNEQTGRSWPFPYVARSERRMAVRLIMGVFLRHIDPVTLCVGHWSPKGDFISLDMATIASEASLCRRRCERSISYLKTVGFVSVFPPQHYCNPVPYAGLRVVRAVTPAFFEWAGLAEAIRGLQDDGGQP